MSRRRCLLLLLCSAALHGLPCHAADLEEIVRRGTATLQSDWAADPDYAYVERDEVQKGDKVTIKTSRVVYIAGSDYYLPLAIDDQPLAADLEKAELQKLKNEVQRRNAETPEARRQRIASYQKQRDENEALVLDFPHAFNFELLREETMNGYPAYVLSGTPKKRTGVMSNAAKVLSGMRGTVWVDKVNFHAVRVECDVVTPVPIYGILAKVLPGTHVGFAMTPVTDSIWLIGEFSMTLKVSKLFLFKSTQVTRSTYSEYRLNQQVLDELLSQASQ
jgi:outer membrane lipoprotein-sorting protein